MSADISVVIPAYNAERHIQKCLESLKNQTYGDFEAIIVVDGATDGTEAACKAFSAADSRFRVIVQPNSGPSGAKNNGISAAVGSFLTFMDSDDYVDKNHLQLLRETIGDSSLAVCGFVNEEADGTSLTSTDVLPGRFDAADILDMVLLSKNAISGSCCNKLYVREIVEKNHIRFYTGQKYMFEDTMFNYEYLKCVSSGTCTKECTYHYVHHPAEGMSRGLTDLESKWMHYTDLLDIMLAENDRRFAAFLRKVSLEKVWHSATAVRVLAHYDRTNNAKYRQMRRYIGRNLPRYLCCSVLPLKKRLGGVLTFFFPKLAFVLWNKGRK